MSRLGSLFQYVYWLAFVIADVPETVVVVQGTERQFLFRCDASWIPSTRYERGTRPSSRCVGHFWELLEWALNGDVANIAKTFCFWNHRESRAIAFCRCFTGRF